MLLTRRAVLVAPFFCVESFAAKKQERINEQSFLQKGDHDCGLSALRYLLAIQYGVNLELASQNELEQASSVGPLSLLQLGNASQKMGFDVTGWRAKAGELRSMPLPSIMAITSEETSHFLAMLKTTRDRLRYFDPASGSKTNSWRNFMKTNNQAEYSFIHIKRHSG